MAVSAKDIKQNIYYDSRIATGPSQRINTLTQISLKQSSEATKALILIPGLNSAKLSKELYEWGNFWNIWKTRIDPELKDYKIFVFRYYAWGSLYESSDILEKAIRQMLIQEKNIKSLNFIGYSQGGLLPRIILNKHSDLESMTDKVITMATGHQGTFVVTPQLVYSAIENKDPIIKFKSTLVLNMLRNRYKFLEKEQAWLDFDKSLPSSANYNPPKQAFIPEVKNKNKFITYGSFFFPFYPDNPAEYLEVFFLECIPRNLFMSSRTSQIELNKIMARKKYNDEKPELRNNLKLNDGVTPLSSALWARVCNENEKQPEEWSRIFPKNNFCPSTELSRVFFGFNHIDWRQPKNQKYKDIMHPDQKEEHIYNWIINDLLNN